MIIIVVMMRRGYWKGKRKERILRGKKDEMFCI
jgi:hypothetical protein